MRRRLVLLVASSVLFVACSGNDAAGSPDASENGSAGQHTPYAVLTDNRWRLQEAVDPPDDAPLALIERPPLAWYAEYVRETARDSAMVRLSGHRATFGEARASLEEVGFAFDDLALQHWHAVGGSAPDDPASPALVILANGPTCLVLLSYELNLDQLVEVAASVEGIDEPAWVAAGGVIQ